MATWWRPVLAAQCVKCGQLTGRPGIAEKDGCLVCGHKGDEKPPKELTKMVGAPLAPSEDG